MTGDRRGETIVTGWWLAASPYCAFPIPETMRGPVSWKRQAGADAGFRGFDDKIISTNHSNIFEVSEKSHRTACDVTRLKYPWQNVAT
jgi:hypothetical protein